MEWSRLFPYDLSLISALVDQWRPETHTFHMTFGEKAFMLQDVSMLIKLPISGEPIGPLVTPAGWQQDFFERFQGVLPEPLNMSPIEEHQKHGPKKQWLE